MKKLNLVISILTFILILLNLDYDNSFSFKSYGLIISGVLLIISSILLLRNEKNKSKN